MFKYIIGLLFCLSVDATVKYPTSLKELSQVTVKITNLEMTSGGTGSVLASFPTGSHILTNKHVCKIVEINGGFVQHKNAFYLVTHYKEYPKHDLCLVRVAADLGISLKVSRTSPVLSDVSYVTGHPVLLPPIMSKGHFSEIIEISLITDVRECTKEEIVERPDVCFWFGGMPVIESFKSQVVSNLIMPGNSGSSVFNSKGQIAGVIFAGMGNLSFGFTVPHKYVADFVSKAYSGVLSWSKVGTGSETNESKTSALFAHEKCTYLVGASQDVKDICKTVSRNLVWKK